MVEYCVEVVIENEDNYMNENVNHKVKFVYHDLENNIEVESVWASKEDNYYRIKNIPFFAPNIAYDDLVSVEEDDGELFFDEIIEESGNSTVQVILFDEDKAEMIKNNVENLHCGWEGSHLKNYFSINVPKDVNYDPLRDFLQHFHTKGILDYKESCLAHK